MENSCDSSRLGKARRIFLLAPALLALGCRGLDGEGAGQPPWGYHRRASRIEPAAATIGRDLHSVPAGTTVPPSGLGVDLVKFEPQVPHHASWGE
jgi:hypothetical protein